MYELVSRESLDNVVGGAACTCAQQPPDDPAKSPPAAEPPKEKGPPAKGPEAPTPPGGGCDQLVQLIGLLVNLFSKPPSKA